MDKKYTSLEHSIRNIMTESVGAIGTDKFTKTGNSFFRSFHAEPKKGDTHPNGNSIRAARNVSNERGSGTMNSVTEEEQLVEFKAPPVAPTIPKPKIQPKVDEPKVEPEVPTEPEKVPEKKPAETPVETPKEVPEKTPTETPKTKQEPLPTTKPEGKTKTDGVPKSEPTGKEKGGTVPDSKKSSATKTDTPTTGKRVPGFPVISFPLAVNPLLGAFGGTHVRTTMHSPQEYMESTEADKIRQSIENVARLGGKNRITKQGEIKAKIIDENIRKANIVRDAIKEKKAGKNPLVDTKPKLKDLELDEKFVGRAAAVGGAGVAGYGGALDAPRKTFDKYKTPEEQEKALKGQKDIFGVPNERYGGVDVVTDVASMLPIVGTPAALYGAKRAYDRGDYTDTALNLVSAIPGVGTAVKGLKFLSKGAGAAGKALQKGGTVASDLATGVQLGDIPYQVNKMSQETGEGKGDLYKGIANTFYSDIKTDVVEPIAKKIKKPSIEIFGGPTSSAPGKKLSP